MSEIDKSVFRIPNLEREQANVFDAPKQAVIPEEIAAKDIAPKEIVVQKVPASNLYEELTAISEEILECRSQILETC